MLLDMRSRAHASGIPCYRNCKVTMSDQCRFSIKSSKIPDCKTFDQKYQKFSLFSFETRWDWNLEKVKNRAGGVTKLPGIFESRVCAFGVICVHVEQGFESKVDRRSFASWGNFFLLFFLFVFLNVRKLFIRCKQRWLKLFNDFSHIHKRRFHRCKCFTTKNTISTWKENDIKNYHGVFWYHVVPPRDFSKYIVMFHFEIFIFSWNFDSYWKTVFFFKILTFFSPNFDIFL